MAMRTGIRIALLAIVGIATIALFSCAPAPVSIEDRISEFVGSLDGDRSDTYKNLDPSTAAYGLVDVDFWDTEFGDRTNAPYSYTPKSPDTSDPSDVEINISDKSGPLGGGDPYQFVMRNIGDASDNWVIKDIRLPAGGGSGASIF
jgi:hypothetical protein